MNRSFSQFKARREGAYKWHFTVYELNCNMASSTADTRTLYFCNVLTFNPKNGVLRVLLFCLFQPVRLKIVLTSEVTNIFSGKDNNNLTSYAAVSFRRKRICETTKSIPYIVDLLGSYT